jgi:hypothetical protein
VSDVPSFFPDVLSIDDVRPRGRFLRLAVCAAPAGRSRRGRAGNTALTDIDGLLATLERLAEGLRDDPDRHVLRSALELRTVFGARGAVEPAVTRVRDGILGLRRANHDGPRREFQRRAHGVDRMEAVVEWDLLPQLRRIGFEV